MVDVTIKDVPSGAEDSVMNLGMVAIERFIKTRDVKVEKEVSDKFTTDINTIREANGLEKKYPDTIKEEVLEP